MTTANVTARLTPDEDEALRRLHYFEGTGAALSADMHQLKAELLARDLRREIREPRSPVTLIPEARRTQD